MFIDDGKNNGNSINNLSTQKGYSMAKDDKSAISMEAAEKQFADGEYIKSMQKALSNAINENEEVSDLIHFFINALEFAYYFSFKI